MKLTAMRVTGLVTSAIFILCAIVLAMSFAPMKAMAQVSGTYTCEARSPYAYGYWTHVNGNYACQRALEECSYRTPVGSTCYVTRWWFNY